MHPRQVHLVSSRARPRIAKYSDFQNILIYRNTNQRYISRHPAPLGGALRNVNNAERAAVAAEVAF
jgi:hypothetical protein